jgi:cation diffusion facilitator CzcD-associated flavoprotein CzcO
MQGRSVQDGRPGDLSLGKSRGPRVAVVGGGFSGIAVAYYMKKAKLDNFIVFESSDDPGGVWNDNRYPGAEVDVVSHLYCFTFNMNDWSQRFGSQTELKRYLGKTVDEFGLRPHFRFNTTVVSATWSDNEKHYTVHFADGRQADFDVVISCVGYLNVPMIPAGIDMAAFPGIVCHTSRWRDDIVLDCKRVGVVGTGASAVQVVAEAAKVAKSVTVFQRSPTWVVPKKNRAFSAGQRARYGNAWQYRYKYLKELFRHERIHLGRPAQPGSKINERFRAAAHSHLSRSLAGRPDLVEKLLPDHPYGAKRPAASDAYYPALRQQNVSLAPAVAKMDADGLKDEQGNRHDLDVVILATGFRATDYLSRLKVKGRNGADLHEAWSGEPAAFLGSCVPSFPNFFMCCGPNSVTGTMVFVLECQAQFVAGCIAAMVRKGKSTVEVRQSAFDAFNGQIQARLQDSVYKTTRNYYASPSGRIVTQWPFSATRFWWLSRTARRSSMIFG